MSRAVALILWPVLVIGALGFTAATTPELRPTITIEQVPAP
jgi:hypothetical protein